jgi:hypothetical protein
MVLNHFSANSHLNLHDGNKNRKKNQVFFTHICLSRKSVRESTASSGTTGGAMGNNMTGSVASASSSSYRRPPDLNNTNMTTSTAGNTTTNDNLVVGDGDGDSGEPGDIKPRSLRFTWSMKTTSSMDPSDMIKEIRKVKRKFLFNRKKLALCFLGARYK